MMQMQTRRESTTLLGSSWSTSYCAQQAWLNELAIINEYPRRDTESAFCRDFSCCGKTLDDLHELLSHYEECHVDATAIDESIDMAHVGKPMADSLAISKNKANPNMISLNNSNGLNSPMNSNIIMNSRNPNDIQSSLSNTALKKREYDTISSSSVVRPLGNTDKRAMTSDSHLPNIGNAINSATPNKKARSVYNGYSSPCDLLAYSQSNGASSYTAPMLLLCGDNDLHVRSVAPTFVSSSFSNGASGNEDRRVDVMLNGPPSSAEDWICAHSSCFPTYEKSFSFLDSVNPAMNSDSMINPLPFTSQASPATINPANFFARAPHKESQYSSLTIDSPGSNLIVVDKPFKCPVVGCEKAYKNQNGLKYHKLHGHCIGTFPVVAESNNGIPANKHWSTQSVNSDSSVNTSCSKTNLNEIEKPAPELDLSKGKQYLRNNENSFGGLAPAPQENNAGSMNLKVNISDTSGSSIETSNCDYSMPRSRSQINSQSLINMTDMSPSSSILTHNSYKDECLSATDSESLESSVPPSPTTSTMNNPVIENKPYRCELCSKRYKNLNGLKYHRSHSHLQMNFSQASRDIVPLQTW